MVLIPLWRRVIGLASMAAREVPGWMNHLDEAQGFATPWVGIVCRDKMKAKPAHAHGSPISLTRNRSGSIPFSWHNRLSRSGDILAIL